MAELLFVPFKKSADVDIVKPLKNLIQSTYNTSENNVDYTEALNELSRLRSNAIWKIFEKSSLEVIYSYYDQLVSLESKIPPQDVQIPFKWKDAFDKGSLFGGRMSLTISSLGYERMCVLFNIGALQSALAAQQPLDTEDSLKLAAKLLQQSAGVFAYMKANVMMAVHQETTPDLAPDTLHALSQLMLAQAQEVIAYKCIRDEMKESMVAKVCAQAEELYTEALRALQREQQRPLWDRDWLPAAAAKQQVFRGLAHYYQSLVCRAARAAGEEIARLRLAVDALRAAPPGLALVAELAARAARNLAAANKDNDFIYHERIPEPGQLEPVARAPVARALPPPAPPAGWAAGRDPFAALLPAAVQQALRAGDARRAELAGAELDGLRAAAQQLSAALVALNLPACIERAAAADGLPASIRDKAAAVRAAGGLPALQRLVAELPELLQRNKDILDEAERMLREEAEADAMLRAQFGARWSRTPSDKLTEAFRANAAKYRQIIDNAIRADDIVQQKFAQHKEAIGMLGGSEEDMAAGVPGDAAAEGDPAALEELRALMEQVEELQRSRGELEAELKELKVDLRSTFSAALAAQGAVDEPALSAAALGAALAPLRRRAAALAERQAALLGALQPAHARYTAGRAPDSRDAALARLAAAHDAHHDLSGNLREGVKFYNDLTQLLVAFQNKVSDFCFARKTEKEELMKDLTQEAARQPARSAPDPPQRLAGEPEVVARRDPPAAPAAPGRGGLPRPRLRPSCRRRRAALPAAAARHAAAVRRHAGVRAAHAGHVQPVRHAAVPAPRAHAAAAALPALPVPARRRLPALPAAARRLQPLPAAVVPPAPRPPPPARLLYVFTL